MGLFSRRKPQPQSLSQIQPRPSTPTPSTSQGSVEAGSSRVTSDRPGPPSPSASSVISRISRKPWGRSKPKPKSTATVNEESPFLTVPSVPPPRNTSARDLRTVGHAASSTSPTAVARPRAASTLGIPDDPILDRQAKVSSGEFRKQGGILGKLEFEGAPATAGPPSQPVDAAASEVGSDWLELNTEEGVVLHEDAQEGALSVTAQVSGLSETCQSKKFPQETRVGNTDDALELLDSPEADKKEKLKDKGFWKGKRKARNNSSAPSDFSVERVSMDRKILFSDSLAARITIPTQDYRSVPRGIATTFSSLGYRRGGQAASATSSYLLCDLLQPVQQVDVSCLGRSRRPRNPNCG